jgi:hypothetical protein
MFKCFQRQDECAEDVSRRLDGCIDLPAAEAVHHRRCQVNFYTGRQIPGMFGKPQVTVTYDSKQVTFDNMCKWLETNAGDEEYSVAELQTQMIEECGNADAVYSVRWINQLLKGR